MKNNNYKKLKKPIPIISLENKLENTNLGFNILAKSDVFIEVMVYEILTRTSETELNIFETTILKLVHLYYGNLKEIAFITGLEDEENLLSIIVQSLQDKKLLNEYLELTFKGKETLNLNLSAQENSNYEADYESVYIFRDILSGKYLPFITKNLEFKDMYFDRNKLISKADKSDIPTKPEPSEITKINLSFARKLKNRNFFTLNPDKLDEIKLSNIKITNSSFKAYLRCQAFINKGNTNVIVTNGFGLGFSNLFSEHLRKYGEDKIKNLRSKAKENSKNTKEQKTNHNKNSSNPNIRFKTIQEPLNNAKNLLAEIEETINSSAKEASFEAKLQNITVNLYQSLEAAFIHINDFDFSNSLYKTITSQNSIENTMLLKTLAEKIGFEINDKTARILQLKAENIKKKSYLIKNKQNTSLQISLSMQIVNGAYAENSLIKNLAMQFKDFFSFIYELKKIRDSVSHGDISKLELKSQDVKNYLQKTKNILQILIPEFNTEDTSQIQTKIIKDDDQQRLAAQVSLDETFTLDIQDSMSKEMFENLIRLETMLNKNTYSKSKNQSIINTIYSILQILFLDVGKYNTFDRITNPNNLINNIRKKIVELGFYDKDEQMPDIRSKTNFIKSATQGKSSTLGAQFLALFLINNQEFLNLLYENLKDTNFIEFVNQIIKLRGHGNESSKTKDLTEEDLKTFKQQTFNLINQTIRII